jgi:predicted nucleic acid-binding Zn ribbon protein
MAEKFLCPGCGKLTDKHSPNHTHCSICAYAINTARSTEKARAKRLAAKEKK